MKGFLKEIDFNVTNVVLKLARSSSSYFKLISKNKTQPQFQSLLRPILSIKHIQNLFILR